MKQRFPLLIVAVTAFLGLCTLLNAQESNKVKILHYTRSQGYEHGPAKLQDDGTTVSGQALKKYFADKNIEVVETQDGGVFDGDIDQYDAFVFYTSGNLLDAGGSKNDKAKPLTEKGLRNLIAAVKNGKGFVGIHSATDTHSNIKDDNQDIYTRFIGARFTGHGPQQFATITVVEPAMFPFLKDAGKRITTWDEWYTVGQINKDMHVLLIQETEGMESGNNNEYARPPFPASWIRAEEKGRVAYSAFGHDNRYFQNTDNVRRIADLIEWSVGRFNADTASNVEKVTPGAFTMPQK